jgi:hypothetical protein
LDIPAIQVTLDTYSHVAPGLQQAAAKNFDDALLNSIHIQKNPNESCSGDSNAKSIRL